jgi:hypothetical protein
MSNSDGNVSEEKADVYHRSIFENPDEEPSIELINIIADIKDIQHEQMDPLYTWADGMIASLYSSPPPAEAQGIIQFTYEGFRITLYQDGQAVIMGRSTSE